MELDLKFQEIQNCEVKGGMVVSHEESLETAIPEYCPDITRIVDTAGQLKVKEKTLSNGRLTISGAVKMTVLYTSEDSPGLRSVVLSIPYSCSVEDVRLVGCRSVCVCGRLTLAEARAITSRKLYVRILPEFEVEGIACPQQEVCCSAEGVPALQVRRKTLEAQMLTDVLEREFQFQQECSMDREQGVPEDLLLDRISLCVTECRRVSTKLVIKGEAYISVLYRGETQGLYCRDAVLPFSQIIDGAELPEEGAYQTEAWAIDSDVRLLRTENGCSFGISIRIGLLIKVYRQMQVEYIEDLYCTDRETNAKKQNVTLETGGGKKTVRSEAVQTLEFGRGSPFVCLTGAYCGAVTPIAEGGKSVLKTNLRLKVLYLDENNAPVSTERVVELAIPAQDMPKSVRALCQPAALRVSGGSCEIKIPVDFLLEQTQQQCLETVESVELQEKGPQERPSLVLRRVGAGEDLWQIAKQYYADPQTILAANRLEEGAPLPEGLLLIPKAR